MVRPSLSVDSPQVRADCCQRLLPLVVHSILLDDPDGSWRRTLSSHIQDFFTLCSRSTQASSRAPTPLNPDSGQMEPDHSWLNSALTCLCCLPASDPGSPGLYDKASLRTMLAVLDYLRHQKRPPETSRLVSPSQVL